MDIVLNILLQLGADKTAFIQFGIFIIAISFLTIFVYGPFFKAYDQRLKQTKGADQVAYETQDEAKKLDLIFQKKAREINEKIKNIFDQSRKAGSERANEILNNSKTTLLSMTDAAKVTIENEKVIAKKDLINISQDVANEISKKITGAV